MFRALVSSKVPGVKRSTDRFLTTHTGSLPRPPDLVQMMFAKEEGGEVDEDALGKRVRSAVAELVDRQAASGIDIVSDGEAGKPSYATYVKDRLEGFGGESVPVTRYQDVLEFPALAERVFGDPGRKRRRTPGCNGPLTSRDLSAWEADAANLRAALRSHPGAEGFMSAASPGVISLFFGNSFYPDHETYLFAIADAMKHEYEAVAGAGFILQVDCPDLAMGRHIQFAELTLAEFRKMAALHVRALNHALAGVSPEQSRIHLCWGNYEGPHHHDVALGDILDIVFEARPHGISFEAANPRHAHEWKVFRDVPLPDGKLLIPGVIESKTNYIEHPELVADRIGHFAELVGRENVIAGVDCGFGTWVGQAAVDPGVVWKKLESLSEGARIASASFW
jgi:5-methyltetrahydropteroyltriglutamate--homocysteine methyltransferase